MEPQTAQDAATWLTSDVIAGLALLASLLGFVINLGYTIYSNCAALGREKKSEESSEKIGEYDFRVSSPLNVQISPIDAILREFSSATLLHSTQDRDNAISECLGELVDWHYHVQVFCVNNRSAVTEQCAAAAEAMVEQVDLLARAIMCPTTSVVDAEKFRKDIIQHGERFMSDVRSFIVAGRRLVKEGGPVTFA